MSGDSTIINNLCYGAVAFLKNALTYKISF